MVDKALGSPQIEDVYVYLVAKKRSSCVCKMRLSIPHEEYGSLSVSLSCAM